MTHALQETTQTQVPAAQLAVPRADPPGREALDRLLQSLPRRLQDRIRLAQDQRILHFSEDIRGDPELAALLEPDQETPDQPEPTPEGETQGNP